MRTLTSYFFLGMLVVGYASAAEADALNSLNFGDTGPVGSKKHAAKNSKKGKSGIIGAPLTAAVEAQAAENPSKSIPRAK